MGLTDGLTFTVYSPNHFGRVSCVVGRWDVELFVRATTIIYQHQIE